MSNEIINPINEKFFMDVLSKIIKESDGFIFRRGNRFDNLDKYLYTYSLLADRYSKGVYARLFARMLAYEFFPKDKAAALFPVWSKEFRENYEKNKATITLPDLKHPNDLASRVIFPETFFMPSYEYKNICNIKEGDIVFDVGAWIGDTSYVFSKRLNGKGHIFAFEPMPQNFEILRDNAGNIPNLSIHNMALGKENGKLKFEFGGSNSGGSRQSVSGEHEVNVSTIDEFVKENSIEKVDYIKADIEGAECDMLFGAFDTIRRFHPKLAICIYHREQTDHIAVPKTILAIRKDYEFYIEAYQDEIIAPFYDGLQETVLYAVPVDQVPERHMPMELDEINSIKDLFISTHNKLFNDYMVNELQKILDALNKYFEYKLDWVTHSNEVFMHLKTDHSFHYKLFYSRKGVEVQILIRNFHNYQEIKKKCLQEILDNFIKTHAGYSFISRDWGVYITKLLPISMATPDNIACNISILIRDTVKQLLENGLIDPECIKPMLYNSSSFGSEY